MIQIIMFYTKKNLLSHIYIHIYCISTTESKTFQLFEEKGLLCWVGGFTNDGIVLEVV